MDEAKLELVRDWLTRASHDLGAACALSSLEHPLLDVAIYHCQQAIFACLQRNYIFIPTVRAENRSLEHGTAYAYL
jgi:hypothetical protein